MAGWPPPRLLVGRDAVCCSVDRAHRLPLLILFRRPVGRMVRRRSLKAQDRDRNPDGVLKTRKVTFANGVAPVLACLENRCGGCRKAWGSSPPPSFDIARWLGIGRPALAVDPGRRETLAVRLRPAASRLLRHRRSIGRSPGFQSGGCGFESRRRH